MQARGRNLVPLAPGPQVESCAETPRPAATFLAHLIATAQQAPQTRQRRRVDPADACRRYAARAGEEVPPTLILRTM